MIANVNHIASIPSLVCDTLEKFVIECRNRSPTILPIGTFILV
jgi:hypothetical protein